MSRGRLLRNISLIILGLIMALAILAIVLRNSILEGVLPGLVYERSGQKVSLEMEDFYLGLNGDLYLVNADLEFAEFFLDKAGSMQLNSLSFDTIHVYGASFRSALFETTFIADSIKVTRPKVSITEHQRVTPGDSISDIDPERIRGLLGKNDGKDAGVRINISRILVDYGELDLEALGVENPALEKINFSVRIENFSTLAADDTISGRILYSDDIVFEVANIEKVTMAG